MRIAARSADRGRPGGRSRALQGVGRRHRRDPQGRGRRVEGRRCSPASTRRRSTAARGCTSNTSRASSRRWSRTSPCTRGATGRRAVIYALGGARRRRAVAGRAAGAVDRPDDGRAAPADADLVHSHTWYANLGGHLAKLVHGIPHVATVHSLEPLRPWKAEQLGGGYAISSWAEKTALEGADAVIAVSAGHSRTTSCACYPAIDPERVHVIHNGIDTDAVLARPRRPTCSTRYGVDPERPSVVFVGRITRQKGVEYLLRAAARLRPRRAARARAPAPPTRPSSGPRSSDASASCGPSATAWSGSSRCCPRPSVIQLLSHATVFVCPSIYEPLGIVNLEAMACEAAGGRDRAPAGSSRSSTTARPACSCRSSPATTAPARPRDPQRFAARLRRARQRAARRPRARRRDGAGRPPARDRAVRLADDRRADVRAVSQPGLRGFAHGAFMSEDARMTVGLLDALASACRLARSDGVQTTREGRRQRRGADRHCASLCEAASSRSG